MKLFFVHGSGCTKEVWHYQTSYFKGSEAVDLPGHPRGQPLSSIEEYMEGVRGYLQRKGYNEVVLAGHSMGGAIALSYALKYPRELKALLLLSTGARLRVHLDYLNLCKEGMEGKDTWLKNLEERYHLVAPEVREMVLRRRVAVGPAVNLNDFLCCNKFDVMERVQGIQLPTLVLCGTEDAMTPVKYTRYLAQRIKGAKEVVIEGATHLVMLEKPQEVNRAIEEFLRGL